ncbi:MAG: 2-isopropylmalate synthase [Candidatus Hydrogenedentota bacterium]
MADRVEIFDTTLRDGEQSPGSSMNVQEKIQMALQLEKLGVDTIEAGFPVASDQEFEGVSKVAKAVSKPRVAALARTLPLDIERAAKAIDQAKQPVLHTFIATSDIHLEHKLKMTRQQVLDRAGESVRLAKSLIGRVEFSAEDASRSDLDYLAEVTRVAIEAGADVINLPDTVGYTTPGEIEEMFRYVISKNAAAKHVVFSCHNHNDLGLAVANALAAVKGGARQIECCVNGIGERAGNTSIEEVVMAMRVRQNVYPFETGIVAAEILNTSQLLGNITGLAIPYNKPIVGRNAFAHESGIHQHGVIASRITYEIMTPESIGRTSNELVLGKHSGKHGLSKRCENLGFTLSPDDITKLYEKFIALADKKKEIFEDDLRVLIASIRDESFETFVLESVRTSGGELSMALVQLRKGSETIVETAAGDGPVDAAFQAIERAVNVHGRLADFSIRSASPGKDALGTCNVTVDFEGKLYYGHGASTDIVEAAAHAFLNAVNKYVAIKGSKV